MRKGGHAAQGRGANPVAGVILSSGLNGSWLPNPPRCCQDHVNSHRIEYHHSENIESINCDDITTTYSMSAEASRCEYR